jgi:CBS domain-containing protein
MDRTTQKIEGSYVTPAFEHATVMDAMRPEVLTCPPSASLRDVARTMASEHVHCMFIWGGGQNNGWGVVSAMDLMRFAPEDVDDCSAASAAASEFLAVSPDEPLDRAVRQMVEHDVTHLIVVDPESRAPVGVLSTLDVAGVLAWGRA